MNELLLIKNREFLDIIKSNEDRLDEFISIIEILKNLSYKIVLSDNECLEEIYTQMYKKARTNEDIRIISKLFEKMFALLNNTCYEDTINQINNAIKRESKSFEKVLKNNKTFYIDLKKIGFKLNINSGIRNISSLSELKRVLLLFCKGIEDIKDFIDKLKYILNEIVFDKDIVDSITKLNDGFDLRKNEIIYHLYIIENEVPRIIKDNFRGYREISDRISLDCSPERDRDTVASELKTFINDIEINCELHTKMKKISTKAPDRIYFCPSLPDGTGSSYIGKIFIYKITKHV